MSAIDRTMTETTATPISLGHEARESLGGVAVPRNVYVSLKEMWEIYIKAVKSTDKSADNAKVCVNFINKS